MKKTVTNNRPGVSVILPVRNGEDCIESAVRSVLDQTFTNFELIAVDDGSKDRTPEILGKLAGEDPRIHILRLSGTGVSRARNAGLEAAEGLFAAFLDSDDVTGPGWLMSLVEGMGARSAVSGAKCRTGAPEPSCVSGAECRAFTSELSVCGYETMSGGKRKAVTSFEDADLTPAEFMGRVLRYRDLTTAVWNKMFLLDVIREHGIRFPEDLRIGEDMVFIAEYLAYVKNVRQTAAPAYIYQENAAGAMGSFGRSGQFQAHWLDEWTAILRTERILEKQGIVLPELRIKKVRIAGKLLPVMRASGFRDREVEAQLLAVLRENRELIFSEDEFTGTRKLLMGLAVISPELAGFVRKISRKRP